MRLRRRFLVAFLLLTVVLSALSLAGFTLYRDATVAQEEDDLQEVSVTMASQLDVLLTEKGQTVGLWADTPPIADHGSPAQSEAVRTFVFSTSFSGASVIAANGTMMALHAQGTTPPESQELVGQQFGDRTYFQRAMDGQTYVSDPVEAQSGNQIVTVSAPIREGGEIVGTFNAAFHVQRGDLFGPIRTRESQSDGVLVTTDDTTVFRSGPQPGGPGTLAVANATVDRTGWTVTAIRTEAAVQSDLRGITILQIGTLALVLASLSVFGWWLYREYVANFERLQEGLTALVAGEYGTTVTLSGPTEWSVVGEHFNELSQTLARRRVEVTVLNRVLRHNLRNAMTVVSGTAARIEESADDEQLIEDATLIKRRGESLLRLAEHARVVETSLRSDRTESPPRAVGPILRDVVADLCEEYPEATVDVDLAAEDAAVPDGDLVTVVVDELIRNAVIHGEDDPTVAVSATATDDTVSVTVDDDGPGLPEVERRLLTESFVETPTEHGSGLGLWVVKWVVDWLDGSIAVAVDDGTTITVTLPYVSGE
jgi:signal transduction histidine kinase